MGKYAEIKAQIEGGQNTGQVQGQAQQGKYSAIKDRIESQSAPTDGRGDFLYSQPSVTDPVAEQPESASIGTSFKAGFVDDPQTKINIFAKARGISPDRYGVRGGEIVYVGDDGQLYPEVADGFWNQAKDWAAQTGAHLPSIIMGMIGTAGGPTAPFLAAGLAAGGEGIRKSIGALAFDEPQTATGNITSMGTEAGMAVVGDKAGQLVGKGANAVRKGMAGRYLDRVSGKDLGPTAFNNMLARKADVKGKFDIDLMSPQASRSQSQKQIYQAFRDYPDSADAAQAFEELQAGQVQRAIPREISKIGPIRDPLEQGELLRETSGSAIKKMEQARSKAFESAMGPKNNAELSNDVALRITDTIDELIDESGNASPIQNIFKGLRKRFVKDGEAQAVETAAKDIPAQPISLDGAKKAVDDAISGQRLSVASLRKMEQFKRDLYEITGKGNNLRAADGINSTISDYIRAADRNGDKALKTALENVREGLKGDVSALSGKIKSGQMIERDGRFYDLEDLETTFEKNAAKIADLEGKKSFDMAEVVKRLDAETNWKNGPVKGESKQAFDDRMITDYRRRFGEPPMSVDRKSRNVIKALSAKNDEIADIVRTGTTPKDVTESIFAQIDNASGQAYETRFKLLHEAKMEVDDLISGAHPKSGDIIPSSRKFAERKFLKLKESILKEMDAEIPEYKTARDVFRQMSEPIGRIKKSTAGRLSAKDADMPLADAVYTLFNPKTTTEMIKRSRAVIEKESPDAWNSAIATYLYDIFDKAKNSAIGGEVINPAGQFYKNVVKNEKQREVLLAAMGQQRFDAFEEFMGALKDVSFTSGTQSRTAPTTMAMNDAKDVLSGYLSQLEKIDLSRPATWARIFTNMGGKALFGKNTKRIIDAMIDPANVDSLKVLQNMSPKKIELLEKTFIGLALAGSAAVSASDAGPDRGPISRGIKERQGRTRPPWTSRETQSSTAGRGDGL